MTFMRRPRVFLSYRHEEKPRNADAGGLNALHRAWVNDFARALAAWNVDVIWDDRLRDFFRPHTSLDPGRLPFLAEASALCFQVAQIFMPIVTRGYLERIASETGDAGYGTVTEEWSRGTAECAAGRAELVAIVREWPIQGYACVPAPIESNNAWDFRFVSPERDEVEFLCDSLHGVWRVERPNFDMPFDDWISQYVRFCVEACQLPWPGIEAWGCDFSRLDLFMDFMTELAAIRSQTNVGSDRDLKEFSDGFGPRTSTWPEGVEKPAPLSTAEETAADEAAKKLARSVFQAHVDAYRRPFDFNHATPGGRASDGLYFGPTQPTFSYLHPG